MHRTMLLGEEPVAFGNGDESVLMGSGQSRHGRPVGASGRRFYGQFAEGRRRDGVLKTRWPSRCRDMAV
jgi:hypothetical protein